VSVKLHTPKGGKELLNKKLGRAGLDVWRRKTFLALIRNLTPDCLAGMFVL
jgi:hypothetical protein